MVELTQFDQVPHSFLRIVQTCLEYYEIDEPKLIFLQYNSGVTFRLSTKPGENYLLKLHLLANGQNPASPHAIAARMQWLSDLKGKTGLPIQTPVRNRQGQWVTQNQDNTRKEIISCTVPEWVEGEPPHGDFTYEQLFHLGQWIAMLHNFSSEWQGDVAAIPSFIPSLLLAKCNNLRISIDLNILTEQEYRQIEQAGHIILAMEKLLRNDPNCCGPIHGDIHHDNVLFSQGDVRVIDFDGLMCIPYVYDIGVILYHIAYQGLAARDALIAGYQSRRWLPSLPSGWIETCITWAAIDNLAFQVTIPEQRNHPLLRKNLIQLAREFCAGLNQNRLFDAGM